jgi:hypothetical protein
MSTGATRLVVVVPSVTLSSSRTIPSVFEDAGDIDHRLRAVLVGGLIHIGVDDNRLQMGSLVVKEALPIGPIGGSCHIVDDLPVRCSPIPTPAMGTNCPSFFLVSFCPNWAANFCMRLTKFCWLSCRHAAFVARLRVSFASC